jgi:hypothetical protein
MGDASVAASPSPQIDVAVDRVHVPGVDQPGHQLQRIDRVGAFALMTNPSSQPTAGHPRRAHPPAEPGPHDPEHPREVDGVLHDVNLYGRCQSDRHGTVLTMSWTSNGVRRA